jgi:ATP-binding cassette, subfamily G (WHITE), member 2
MELLIPSLFTIVVYWLSGLRFSAGYFFATWAAVLLVVLVAQAVGLLLGSLVMNPRTALALATIFMLTIMLVAGFLVRNVPVRQERC